MMICGPFMHHDHMRVLQVLPALNQGGVEHATLDIACGLSAAHPDQPNFIASNSGALVAQLPPQTHHITLPLHSKNPLTILLNAYRLCRVIQKHNISVVHARSRGPGWSAFLACRFTKTPFVTTYHGAHSNTYRSRIVSRFKKFYNSVMARGNAVIAISDFMKRHIVAQYPASQNRIVSIQEGIDTDAFTRTQNAPSSPRYIFCPSRMSTIKGVDILLRAFAQCVYTHNTPDLKLMLMRTGKQNYIDQIDQMIEGLNLAHFVEWQNPNHDLRPLYTRASITVAPSRVDEALGRVSLEALSMQTLLIATHTGATPEICIHGKTGFLVKPDDVEGLTNALIQALSMPKQASDTLKNAGRNHMIDRFSKTAMIEKTLKLYENLHQRRILL